MEFEWDRAKNLSNLARHDVLFEDAIEAFYDPREITRPARTMHGELRWQTLGMIRDTLVCLGHSHATSLRAMERSSSG